MLLIQFIKYLVIWQTIRNKHETERSSGDGINAPKQLGKTSADRPESWLFRSDCHEATVADGVKTIHCQLWCTVSQYNNVSTYTLSYAYERSTTRDVACVECWPVRKQRCHWTQENPGAMSQQSAEPLKYRTMNPRHGQKEKQYW